MNLQMLLGIKSINNQKQDHIYEFRNCLMPLQKSIIDSGLGVKSKNNLIDIFEAYNRLTTLMSIAESRIGSCDNSNLLNDWMDLSREFKTQKVIIETLFKLVNNKCAMPEEISNCKKEFVSYVSKIEDEIILFFFRLVKISDLV